MSWEIVLKSETVEYSLDGKSYHTDLIKFVNEEFYSEPGGYKEPDDNVCKAVYEADSDHGKFSWEVFARRSGFETYATVEHIEVYVPDPAIEAEEPSFDIEEEDEQ